jgi:hypothetical protein
MNIMKILFFLFCVTIFGNCSRLLGDPCSTSSDCETGQICDKTLPGGYCTKSDCHFFGCPSESTCVAFNDFDNYCMLSCSDEKDCREEYTCVTDFADQAFCGAVVEESP